MDAVQAEDLTYVAVEPCRVADTRLSVEGAIAANTSRNFGVWGKPVDLASQGGEVDCPNPKESSGQLPVAIAAYILAIPNETSTGKGVLSAYPSDAPEPPVGSGSTVNFGEGQTVGNTSIIKVCSSNDCLETGQLAILARQTDQDVVIDVQGYFYPAAVAGWEQVSEVVDNPGEEGDISGVTVSCPEGKKAFGGGWSSTDGTPTIDVFRSNPTSEDTDWRFSYKMLKDTIGNVTFYVTCAYAVE